MKAAYGGTVGSSVYELRKRRETHDAQARRVLPKRGVAANYADNGKKMLPDIVYYYKSNGVFASAMLRSSEGDKLRYFANRQSQSMVMSFGAAAEQRVIRTGLLLLALFGISGW